VYLEAGHTYPIRLEYFESKLDAAVTLSWESALQPLEIIPQRQLYPVPARTAEPAAAIWLYPVPASGTLYAEVITNTPESLQAELTDARGRIYRQWALAPADVLFTRYPLDLTGLGAGLYYMRFWGESGFTQTQPVLIRP
jgi:hypothetical protein